MPMNQALRPLILIALVVSGAPPAVAQLSPNSVTVRAENALGVTRTDETIGVPWTTVVAQMPAAAPGQLRVRDAVTGREIVSQVVDNDGDGSPDELLFQATFAPGETRAFALERGAPSAAFAKPRVYARHIEDRDDVAWESDRIAYRIYGQGLWKVDSLLSSGVDVWVKRTRDPIIDKWYSKGHDSYHRDTGEGADFYDVGQTLGAGGTAVYLNDSLYRAWNFKSWRIIANGPIRTIFELQYQPWTAGSLRVSETKRIALDAGQNLNRSTSIFRAEGGVSEIPYAIGIVKRKGMVGSESRANEWAWLTGWGPVSPKDGGHGDLGTAVLIPRSRLVDWKETDNHYFAVGRARSGEPVVHYIGAGWTDSGDFRDVRDWWSYLDQSAQRIASPIRVTFGAVSAR
jgi:pectinesterase